ncbi:MAG: zinc-binding dehydrogenase [Polyangiaceae bacterium]
MDSARGRKVVIEKAGDFGALQVRNFEPARPEPGSVRVRTSAVGVNYADCIVRMGLYASAAKYVGWPITPGFEFAGTVDAVGEGVTRVREGDVVYGVSRFGAYATHVTVDASLVWPRPARFDDAQAAGFPAVNLTAWYALRELVRVRKGNRILIHSAGGGVGMAAVAIAKRLGASVVGVVGGSHKVDAVRAIGADLVIDKSTESLWAKAEAFAPEGYDVVLDPNGVETLTASYDHTGSAGKLVVYGFQTMFTKGRGTPNWLKLGVDWMRTPRFDPLKLCDENKSILAFNLSYLFDRADILGDAMGELTAWVDAAPDPLPAPVVREFLLDDVAKAHEALESGSTIGKLVLRTS